MKVGDFVTFTQMTSQPGDGMRFAEKTGVIRRISFDGWLEIGCEGMRHRRKEAAVKLANTEPA